MEIVFNDYSLNSQFSTSDIFADSLLQYTLPLLELLKNSSSLILKKYQSYDLHITSELSLNDFLTSNQFKGYPEAQKLRSLLVNLRDEPYWEENPKTETDASYCTTYTGVFTGDEPNCFSEAYERDKIILSVENDDFKVDTISVKKNDNTEIINNFYNKQSSLNILFQRNYISFSEFLSNLSDTVQVAFFESNNEIYVDRELRNSDLSNSDMLKIAEYYERWIFGIKTGEMISHLTDSIQHKGISYNEFRVTLDDKREFRMFYKLFGSQYVFFNLLLKDTPTTPDQTKDKTCSLIKKYTALM
ncbi:MAG: hypothetical protein IJN04_02915 [Clostridia bacterium]|nr:hypothetical protein [Clostridia bacterium]